jgi:superfamily II DNA or RNA helicase
MNRNIPYFLLLLIINFALSPILLAEGIDSSACYSNISQILQSRPDALSHLNDENINNFENFIVQHLGEKAFRKIGKRDEVDFRQCDIAGDNCLTLNYQEIGGQKIFLHWTDAVNDLTGHHNKKGYHLFIPREYDFDRLENPKFFLNKWLQGHPLHPYIKSGPLQKLKAAMKEKLIQLREVQKDAIEVGIEMLERGLKSFLVVSPTGTGKTEIFKGILKKKLELSMSGNEKLHIVLADQNLLIKQLENDIRSMDVDQEVEIIRWGDDNNSISFSELEIRYEKAKKENRQIILVSTIQSLKSKVSKERKTSINFLRSSLATLAFDEAHHTGAAGFLDIKNEIDKGVSNYFFFGITATPVHMKTDILGLFENQVFWTYLDKPHDFFSRGAKTFRETDKVVDQLLLAIEQGDLAPIEDIHYLSPILKDGTELFESGEKSRFIIKDEYKEMVARKLRPFIEGSNSGLITVSGQDEADLFADVFNAVYSSSSTNGPSHSNKKFAAYHSDSDSSHQIMEDFKDGKINFLVTIRKLDEGIDLPAMDTYIDLNRRTSARQILQRLGRVLRVALGKRGARVVTFNDLSDESLKEQLSLFARLFEHSKNKKKLDKNGPMEKEENIESIEEIQDGEIIQKSLNSVLDDIEKRTFFKSAKEIVLEEMITFIEENYENTSRRFWNHYFRHSEFSKELDKVKFNFIHDFHLMDNQVSERIKQKIDDIVNSLIEGEFPYYIASDFMQYLRPASKRNFTYVHSTRLGWPYSNTALGKELRIRGISLANVEDYARYYEGDDRAIFDKFIETINNRNNPPQFELMKTKERKKLASLMNTYCKNIGNQEMVMFWYSFFYKDELGRRVKESLPSFTHTTFKYSFEKYSDLLLSRNYRKIYNGVRQLTKDRGLLKTLSSLSKSLIKKRIEIEESTGLGTNEHFWPLPTYVLGQSLNMNGITLGTVMNYEEYFKQHFPSVLPLLRKVIDLEENVEIFENEYKSFFDKIFKEVFRNYKKEGFSFEFLQAKYPEQFERFELTDKELFGPSRWLPLLGVKIPA